MEHLNEVQQVKTNNTLERALTVGAVVGSLALMSTGASAETTLAVPDMTPILTMINGIVAVVASVGMAVLSVYATAKVFKWVKTAF